MNREELMDRVMRARGLEDETAIAFCFLCEDITVADDVIVRAFINIMENL